MVCLRVRHAPTEAPASVLGKAVRPFLQTRRAIPSRILLWGVALVFALGSAFGAEETSGTKVLRSPYEDEADRVVHEHFGYGSQYTSIWLTANAPYDARTGLRLVEGGGDRVVKVACGDRVLVGSEAQVFSGMVNGGILTLSYANGSGVSMDLTELGEHRLRRMDTDVVLAVLRDTDRMTFKAGQFPRRRTPLGRGCRTLSTPCGLFSISTRPPRSSSN